MKVLELFAGSRSIGKEAERQGCEVFSVDINNFDGIDLVKDIQYLVADDIPFIPDMVWASPTCTTYSIAAISHHRNLDRSPKTPFAIKSDLVMYSLSRLIEELLHKNSKMIYYIENPVGLMRKMDFMKRYHRTTVTYCSYGDTRMKPTDVWSNNIYDMFNLDGWNPIPKCYNGNIKCHHEPAPRGSKTGTQGLKGNYERSKIPEKLCEEIIKASIKKLQQEK